MTDRLTLSLYNFAHFLVAIVKLLTAIALVWYRAARAQLLVPVVAIWNNLPYSVVSANNISRIVLLYLYNVGTLYH